ncbi:hypothetical protein [Flavobacterium lindanitolerans]|uniref:hypothetical protein n=1 Tax=Flavobacterium lindanitolerans TaxID=428988 RepID=UPI0023F1C87F|nr:hypothetical protein [Flavobacterium lindanitolerans]
MKNLRLLLALAVVLGAGSAFTTHESVTGGTYVKVGPDDYRPLGTEGPGMCIESGEGCHFQKIGENQYEALDSFVWLPE